MLAIVCADPHDAERLKEEIRWFAPEVRAHVLPDWEVLPYDLFSPHPDIISERLAAQASAEQARDRFEQEIGRAHV